MIVFDKGREAQQSYCRFREAFCGKTKALQQEGRTVQEIRAILLGGGHRRNGADGRFFTGNPVRSVLKMR
jgi:hypothetical protein